MGTFPLQFIPGLLSANAGAYARTRSYLSSRGNRQVGKAMYHLEEDCLRGIEESWHNLGESRTTGLDGSNRGLMCLLRH